MFFWRGMVFWRGTVFWVRLARARRGASVPFGERMRVWGRARLSRFPLSNLPSPLRSKLLSLPNPSFRCSPWAEVWGRCARSFGEEWFSGRGRLFVCALPMCVGGCVLMVKAILFSGGLARARGGACGPALFREGREFGPTPVRVGGVSMRVVSESSRACRASTTVRGVRAFG